MNVGESQRFDYTGGVQSFTVPYTGIYKLEVYGSEGHPEGYPGNGNWQAQGNVGYGGYSKGYKKLKKGDVLYICCGGYADTADTPGYNGGGARYGFNADFGDFYHWIQHNPGGGATHIALNSNRGVLSNYSSYRSEILIVAGGGAGRPWDNGHNGGSGGGSSGGSGSGASGGTQSTGNAFGQGASGAGGGWYGGNYSFDGSGGGSGYIGGVDSFNGDSKVTSNGANGARGYAIITLMKKTSVKLGNTDCDVYLGSTEIDSIYHGGTEL